MFIKLPNVLQLTAVFCFSFFSWGMTHKIRFTVEGEVAERRGDILCCGAEWALVRTQAKQTGRGMEGEKRGEPKWPPVRLTRGGEKERKRHTALVRTGMERRFPECKNKSGRGEYQWACLKRRGSGQSDQQHTLWNWTQKKYAAPGYVHSNRFCNRHTKVGHYGVLEVTLVRKKGGD